MDCSAFTWAESPTNSSLVTELVIAHQGCDNGTHHNSGGASYGVDWSAEVQLFNMHNFEFINPDDEAKYFELIGRQFKNNNRLD